MQARHIFGATALAGLIAAAPSLRLEYERYRVDAVDLDSASIGLQATF